MARKNSGLGIVLIIVIILAALWFGFGGKPLSFAGTTTLGISQATFQSNNAEINGDAYIITLAANGGGESLSGNFAPSDLANAGLTVQNGFKLGIDLNVSCDWSASEESNKFVGTSTLAQTWEGYWPSSWSDPAAPCFKIYCGSGGAPNYCNNPYNIKCYGFNPQYSVSKISTVTNYNWKAMVTYTKPDGTAAVAQLDPQTSTANLEGIGRVKFIGSFVGSSSCPAPYSDTVLLRKLDTRAISAHNLAAYNAFTSAKSSYDYAILSSFAGGGSASSQMSAAYNALLSSTAPLEQTCAFSEMNGTLTYSCQPINPPVIPTIQLVIKKDVLGGAPVVVAMAPKPAIISIEAQGNLYARTASNLKVSLINLGSETGSFDVKLECPQELTWTATRVSLAPQAQSDAFITINGYASEQTCTVTAYNVNDANVSDAKSVGIKIVNPPCPLGCCIGMSDYQDKECALVEVKFYDMINGTKTYAFSIFKKPQCLSTHQCEEVENSITQATPTPAAQVCTNYCAVGYSSAYPACECAAASVVENETSIVTLGGATGNQYSAPNSWQLLLIGVVGVAAIILVTRKRK